MKYNPEYIHNKYAPYWALTMFILLITGVSTIYIKWGGFWNGYVLDIAGPAWSYILIRGLFTVFKKNRWTRFFTPIKSFLIILLVSFGIESIQYFELYDSTFDPFDLLAYISVLLPLFLIDLYLKKKTEDI